MLVPFIVGGACAFAAWKILNRPPNIKGSEDLVVLITGCSTGIGEAAALRLDKLGFRVVATVRKEEDGRRLAGKASPRLRYIIMDVADRSSIEEGMKTVEEICSSKGLYALVNNAGVMLGGPLEICPFEQTELVLKTNLLGPIHLIKLCIPLLRKRKPALGKRLAGRIVNVSSVAGYSGVPFFATYAATKFGLEGLSDSLRLELHDTGVQTILIEPGTIPTPLVDKLVFGGLTQRVIANGGSQALAEEVEANYAKLEMFARATILTCKMFATTPDNVAKAIAHGLTSGSPRLRYRVGFDANTLRFLGWILPAAWYDAFVLFMRHMPIFV